MRPTLSEKNRSDLVKVRFERAMDRLNEAKHLLDAGLVNGAMNRVYYACFSAACGLLLSKAIETQTHKGVRLMLGLHFFKTGLIEEKHGAHYTEILDARQHADYDDYAEYDQETAERYYCYAQEIIEAFRQAL